MAENITPGNRPAGELIHERQLTPGIVTRVLIPAIENVLAGAGILMLVAVVLADWSALDIEAAPWLPLAGRLATATVGVLFVLRFGSDEVRFLVELVSNAYYARRNVQRDAWVQRLEWENSQLRQALVVAKERLVSNNYVAAAVPLDDGIDPINDALLILNKFRNRMIPRISRRAVVEQAKIVNRERFEGAMLVFKQAGVIVSKRGEYSGMVLNGKRVDNATVETAIVAVQRLREGVESE